MMLYIVCFFTEVQLIMGICHIIHPFMDICSFFTNLAVINGTAKNIIVN